ncbi:MAG: tyrosine-type recombinase/integrase [Bacteroidota bacterium]|nr:tyrosine-type recombinase/integrase [Bacteroidota bacterium]
MEQNLKAFVDYLLYEKKYSPQTVVSYRRDIQSFYEFLTVEFQETSFSRVQYALVRSWIVSLSEQKLSNSSINRKISSLKTFYKFLQKIGQIDVDIFARHKSLKNKKKIQIPFSKQELLDVKKIEYQNDFEGVRDRLIIELFYSTGIRRAELISIRLRDVDLSTSTLKVLGKRNKERIIPLLKGVQKLIQEYLSYRSDLEVIEDVEFFFLTKRGIKMYEMLVYRIINDYFSAVSEKLKKSPHVLRHSFATHLLDNGADLNSVKELLGHSSLASTQIYINTNLQQIKEVYSKSHPHNK